MTVYHKGLVDNTIKMSFKKFLFQQVVLLHPELMEQKRVVRGRVEVFCWSLLLGFVFFFFYYKWQSPIHKWIRVKLVGVLEMRDNSWF